MINTHPSNVCFLKFLIRNSLALLLILCSSIASAVTFNVPSTDDDGNFVVSWSGARTYAQLHHQVNGSWVSIYGGNGSGTFSFQVTGKPSGVHSYMLSDCLVTGGQYGTTTTCSETIKSITIATQSLPVVSTPSFNPNGGTFNNSVSVSLNSATAGATIRYTTNNTAVTSASPIYT